ncbi:hypothetical protein D516_3373 [Rhodobacter sp. AKP1]|nr:hypothetical protein D516_3373 [Rhodobacter sp. AKP1]
MERHGAAHLPHRQPALPYRSRHQRPPSCACRRPTPRRRSSDRSGGSPSGGDCSATEGGGARRIGPRRRPPHARLETC